MQIRPVGAELFHVGRRTDRHDESRRSRFAISVFERSRSQYPEGPATGHLDTGFSWVPCAQKQMLRRFPTFQVATTCFSCSPPDLNLLVTNFMFCIHVK